MADYNVENAMSEQEQNEGRVAATAVEKAKENMASKKLEQEAKEVERRLSQAEETETRALKELRMARKKEDAQKTYLTEINKAKADFESTGDYRAYDKAVEEAVEKRDKAIEKGKREVYGDDYWRH